jgi:signal peptidase I
LGERIVIRLFATALLTTLAVLVGVYFLNPLQTAATDPLFRVAGYKVFRIPSRSMQPTIGENVAFLVSAWPYRNADPKAGDIVVFTFPMDPSGVFAKRVIADGGSTVEIVEGVTIVNGRPLDEPYVDPRNKTTEYSRHMFLIHVPPNDLFVLGDNRDNSNDSRRRGFVPRSHIIGKVVWVSTPNNRWRGP